MRFEIGPRVRVDLVAYAAPNFSGQRRVLQCFPTGARKGQLDGTRFRSVVVRALPGTRVVFCASDRDTWDIVTWRAVRILEGHSMPSQQRNGLPGVRIPDLDRLDRFDAKRTDPDFESSYPVAETLDDGEGWTFGRPGQLANRVAMIRIEREDIDSSQADPTRTVTTAILDRLQQLHPDALPTATQAAHDALSAHMDHADIEDLLGPYRG